MVKNSQKYTDEEFDKSKKEYEEIDKRQQLLLQELNQNLNKYRELNIKGAKFKDEWNKLTTEINDFEKTLKQQKTATATIQETQSTTSNSVQQNIVQQQSQPPLNQNTTQNQNLTQQLQNSTNALTQNAATGNPNPADLSKQMTSGFNTQNANASSQSQLQTQPQQNKLTTTTETKPDEYTSDEIRAIKAAVKAHHCEAEFPSKQPAIVRGAPENLVDAVKNCGNDKFITKTFTLNLVVNNPNDPIERKAAEDKINSILLKASSPPPVQITNVTINNEKDSCFTITNDQNQIVRVAIKDTSPTVQNSSAPSVRRG